MASFQSTQQPQKLQEQRIQTKSALKIGAPNDRYEQEADSMADRIMRMPQQFSQQPLGKRRPASNANAPPALMMMSKSAGSR